MATLRHLSAQGPMLRALGRVALAAVLPRRRGAPPALPGPWIEAELPPRPEALVSDYLAHLGVDPSVYRGSVPVHLFPQWGFPLAARTLEALPYAATRAVNAGCRIDVRGPLPAGEPLLVRARLETVDDDGRRALITQRLVTGTRSAPEAMTAELRVHVPLRGKGEGSRSPGGAPAAPRARPAVPAEAEALAVLDVGARAGLDFALLTGDFNPIHWVPAYARRAGFPSTILHGFATLARAFEALRAGPCGGDPGRLRTIDVRFTKPLVLPARVSVYTTPEGGVWVGTSPGSAAYLEGRFETTETETPR
jgi:MaoC like domain